MKNLNYLFNVDYYSELKNTHFEYCNDLIIKQQWIDPTERPTNNASAEPILFADADNFFMLKTVYPGLLIGLGYTHGIGKEFFKVVSDEGTEIKLGFTLDFVTGLPIIPGSTVKGVLHSAFVNHSDYVQYLFEKFLLDHNLAQFTEIVFGSPDSMSQLTKRMFGSPDSMGRCIFYDAIPVKANSKRRLLGIEYITPHKAPDSAFDGLTNPIPLALLKVLPGVSFLFRFGFDKLGLGKGDKDAAKEVFERILITLGIGAKTNVGFGALEHDDSHIPKYMLTPLDL